MAYATLRGAMGLMSLVRPCRYLGLLVGVLTVFPACGSSERLIAQDPHTAIVLLTPFTSRGATGRYPGALQPIQASHPIALSPDHVARILSGIQIGIIPADSPRDAPLIKPTGLLSESEIAAIAPGISAALRQASSDQYVRFQVGADPESSEGALYVEGSVLRFTLNRYRSISGRRDESLAIYALSFTPESARMSDAGGRNWLDTDAGHPRLTIAYGKLAAPPSAQEREPAAAADRKSSATTQPANGEDMKATVERQAEELKSVKEELESIKKELKNRQPPSPSAP